MTDGFDQLLVQGGLDLLTADPQLVVFDGVVPTPTPDVSSGPGYVLVDGYVEWPAGAQTDSLDGLAGSPTVRWICHCVGGSAKASRAVSQRVRTQLLNKRLVVAGLNLGLIKQESGVTPPQRDESTGHPVMDTIVTYRSSATT